MPDEPEVHGLLAMMLLHDARRDARYSDGDLVLLADQDSSLWDAAQLAQGGPRLTRLRPTRRDCADAAVSGVLRRGRERRYA